MASITLTFSAADGARIVAALASTPYPKTAAGFKEKLIADTMAWLGEYERNERTSEALKQVAVPVGVVIT